jgi:protein TonB
MSYAQKKQISANRTPAIIIVVLIHLALGYALVTGLAYNVIKQAAAALQTFDVEEEPPPPEDPPPPEKQPDVPPRPQVAAPPPLVRTNITAPQIQTTPNPPPFVPTPIARPAPPAPPAPPPVKRIEPKSAVGSLQGLIRDDDYPSSALDREEQGTVSVSLSIGTNGRVSACSIVSSSGSRTLDSTTCRILTSRAKFTPARDSTGAVTTGTVPARITWRIAG